jgi:hypothetical protein
MRHDLAVGKLAHFLAHRVERVVEAAIADRRADTGAHQRDQPRPIGSGVAARDQVLHGGSDPGRHLRGRQRDVGRPHHLALAHGDAADDLGEILADADPDQQLLDLAQTAGGIHPLRIGGELAHRLHIGGKPGKSVGGALLTVERLTRFVFGEAAADGKRRVGEQRLGGGRGVPRGRHEVVRSVGPRGEARHDLLLPASAAIVRRNIGTAENESKATDGMRARKPTA